MPEHTLGGEHVETSSLADAGPASLRIDFRGSGESTADLNFAETTFDGQTADGIAAIAYLKPLDSIRSDDFHIIS